jgi:hypothetical protein
LQFSTGISSNAILLGRVVSLDVNTDSNATQILPSSQTAGVVMSTAIVGSRGVALGRRGSATNTRGTVIRCGKPTRWWSSAPRRRAPTSRVRPVGKNKALVWDSTLTIHKVDLCNSTIDQRARARDGLDRQLKAIQRRRGLVPFLTRDFRRR